MFGCIASIAGGGALGAQAGCAQSQDFAPDERGPGAAPETAADAGGGATPLPPALADGGEPEWTWLNPSPRGEDILAIGGVADDDLWFVGLRGTVLRWNGKTVTSAYKGAIDVDYYTVAVSAPDDVWVGGRSLKGAEALHWNGVAWSSAYSLASSDIHALVSLGRNDVWAATGGSMRHWDGAAWTPWPIEGTPRGASWVIRDLWGAASNDAWAVGDDGLVAHWDGVRWSKMPGPIANGAPFDAAIDYVGIWGSAANDIWAAYVPPQRTPSVGFAHWDGTRWTTTGFQPDVPGAMVGGAGSLGLPFRSGKRVWGTSRTNVVAAPFVHHLWTYDGSAWRVLDAKAETRVVSPALGGVRDVYVTGRALDIRRYDPTVPAMGASRVPQLVSLFPAMRDSLSHVAAAPDGAVFAAEELAKVHQWSGGGWKRLPSPALGQTHQLAAVSAGEVWLAGTRGALDRDAPEALWRSFGCVRRYKDGVWSTPIPDEEETQRAQGAAARALVFASASNEVWVTRNLAAEVQRFDGAAWSRIPVDVGDGTISQIGGSPGNVWVVSSRGDAAVPNVSSWRVHRWDGAAMREVHRGTYADHPGAIWAPSPNDVWIAGRPGIRFDGSRWTTLPLGTDQNVRAVWGTDPSHVWFLAGTEVHAWNGSTARRELRGHSWNLRGLAASPGAGLWVVGDQGTTLRLLPALAPR